MADDSVYADLLDSLSPLTRAGIDPDDARMNRAAAMQQLMGTSVAAPVPWYQPQDDAEPPAPAEQPAQQQATTPQQVPTPQPVRPSGPVSPNGNPLPPGLKSRQLQPAAPAVAPMPAVPSSVTPNGNPTTLADLAAENAGTLKTNADLYKSTADYAQKLLSEPDVETQLAPDRARLAQDTARANASPYVPGTTKLIPDYKPSFAQRIMRGVGGFARGGVFGAVDPTIGGGTAYGAPNNLYRGQVARAQKDAAADTSTIASKLQAFKDQHAASLANVKEIGSLATGVKDISGANLAQQDQPNKDADAASRTTEANARALEAQARQQEADNSSPDAKADLESKEYDQRKAHADSTGLKGINRTLYLLNNKIPDPRQPTDDEIATQQALQIFQHQNGHPPQTTEEYNEVRRAAKGADKQLGTDGKPLPTVADKNRASLAHVASDNLDQLEKVLNRRPDLFGKLGGRVSNLDDLIGSNDPDLRAVGNIVHNFAMANAGIHGSRSHENVRDAENELISHMNAGAEGIRGGIKANRENLKTIIDRVEGKGSGTDDNANKPTHLYNSKTGKIEEVK